MKIRKLRLTGFQQFGDTTLDFTHPETGQALERICLIGRNGTGKSTVLEVIESVFAGENRKRRDFFVSGELETNWGNPGFVAARSGSTDASNPLLFQKDGGEMHRAVESHIENADAVSFLQQVHRLHHSNTEFLQNATYSIQHLFRQTNSDSFFIVSPPYTVGEQIQHLPETNLDKAIETSRGFPAYHLITAQTVGRFWENLIYALRERDRLREEFENRPENIQKTKKQLIEEFDALNPTVLDGLAEIWNRLLAPAGLEFDAASVRKPVQLHDNLEAFVRLKSTGERVPYNRLSTGIRDFIFRIGHIYSIFFNREVKSGFLLVDEPENSLFPEFLYELMDVYRIASTDKRGENHTQLFVATHNPIIAAQFEPHERIILDWAEDGTVSARRGTAPAGDDPNDVLKKDFELDHLMGAKGIEMWERYLDLRRRLRNTGESPDREAMVAEIQKIGNDYNFLPQ